MGSPKIVLWDWYMVNVLTPHNLHHLEDLLVTVEVIKLYIS